MDYAQAGGTARYGGHREAADPHQAAQALHHRAPERRLHDQDFVVKILEHVFDKPAEEAHRIMLEVHEKGRGVCGAYPWEVAETKVALVHELARREGFPLRADIEEA